MNFWERVDELLERKDINKKALAADAGFDASNITKGIKQGNIPNAETAVKIAKILNVSVEYLVTGQSKNTNTIYLSGQVLQVAEDFSNLSDKGKRIVVALIKEIQAENV